MEFNFKTTPFNHQLQAFEAFKDHGILALLADMGVGKSKIAIDISAYKFTKGLHNRVLIIAPTSVTSQWLNEQFPLHCPVPYKGFSFLPNKTLKYAKSVDRFMMYAKDSPILHVLTINYEAFVNEKGIDIAERFFKTSKLQPIIICDEASRIKTPKIKTTRNVKRLARAYKGAFKVIMTGTPAAKSPVDMWSIFDFLKPRYMGCSYTTFKFRHSIIVKKTMKLKDKVVSVDKVIDHYDFTTIHKIIKNNTVNGRINPIAVDIVCKRFGIDKDDFWFLAGSTELKRFKNIEELQELIAPVTFSVSKEDIFDLPPKIYNKISFPLSREQKKLIDELKNYSLTVYDDKELTIMVKAALGMRILQICGGNVAHHTDIEGKYATTPIKSATHKINYLIDDIPEIGNCQFIVWAVFTAELNMIYDRLSKLFNVALLSGATKDNQRTDTIEAFKAGDIQGLVAHPQVGGYGLNLQMAGVQYWYSRDYRTEVRLQAEERSHRAGITKSVVYKDLLYDIPLEHNVLSILQEGKDINDFFVTRSIIEIFRI